MAQDSTKPISIDQSGDPEEGLQDDLALFRAMKPYIGHCLTLNHDLNNPLAGILGYAEFLQNDQNLNEEQKHNLHQIVACAERMKNLIENLCIHKMELAEKIDLAGVTEAYIKAAQKLD